MAACSAPWRAPGDLAGDLHLGQTHLDDPHGSGRLGAQHPQLHRGPGLGVGVTGVGFHDGGTVVEVELHHPVGPALVQVHRPGMHHLGGAGPVDGAHEGAVGEGDAHLVR